MGLDMYLYGVKEEFGTHDYNIGGKKEFTEIGYWRKANSIHKWFVDNVQNGEDDCELYTFSEEKLKNLKAICEDVLKNPHEAENLLPTQSGFFFGGTEYDSYYFEDMKDTIEIIDWALAQEFDYFAYESSW